MIRKVLVGLLRLVSGLLVAALLAAGSGAAAPDATARTGLTRGTAVVTYADAASLARALGRHGGVVVRRIPALRVAEIRPRGDAARYGDALAAEPGIVRVERALPRRAFVEPALVPGGGGSLQWQYEAVGADRVPAEVAAAAAGVTIAVIDTGADVGAPDLAAKAPLTRSVRGNGGVEVTDVNGHGTFVAALAAGAGSNGEGVAGVAGEAKLMVVQAGGPTGSFTDVDEAAAIVYAVDHGAKILNLSLGGPTTSATERRAIEYAVSRDVLLVAAVGNGYANGNPVEYPAALLQPVGSRGAGGRGLAVGASTRSGTRAAFSATGTHLSLLAPGEGVFSAVSSTSPRTRYPRTPLPGSTAGLYGFGSGTSFAAPQVAGAAALVWAANPRLRAHEVAAVIEATASGGGTWQPGTGFGVLDVAAAVARSRELAGAAAPFRVEARRTGGRVALSWPAVPAAVAYELTVAENGGAPRALGRVTSTSAAFDVSPGAAYSFGVAALDAAGARLAAADPVSVSLRPAPARLSLRAVRAGRRVELDARLLVVDAPGAEARRTVVLESHDGRRWSRAATAVTDATGRAVWRYALSPGHYRLRVRHPGADDVAAAASDPVTLRIP